jgi:hypothetical protein
MAATPKPVRKYAKRLNEEYKKKFPSLGMHGPKGSKRAKANKEVAKVHAEKDLVTRKGHPKKEKMKHGVWKGQL